MKKVIISLSIVTVAVLLIYQNLNAIGGRGGGFGGHAGGFGGRGGVGGAGGRGGFEGRGGIDNRGYGGAERARPEEGARTWDRSPSMARSYRPGVGTESYARPYAGARPFDASHAATETQVDQFLRNSPAPVVQARRTPLTGPVGGAALAADNRTALGTAVRRNVGDAYPGAATLFDRNFWAAHPNHYPFAAAATADWWRHSSWYAAANWLDYPIDGEPLYYDNNGYAYPENQGTSNGQANAAQEQTQSAPQQQTSDTTAAGIANQQSGDWLPLGVFALTQEKKNAPTPTMYMQLALNKSGEIGGNLYDKSTDKTYPLVGKVDPKTQKAVWRMSQSDESPYAETGLYNLTKNETPVLITFADGRSQKAFLVRINQGENSSAQ